MSLVLSNRNRLKKVIRKLSKYKDLEIEATRMWGMRTGAVPIIVGALGLIRKGMDQNLGKIPGAIHISELHNIILLGMAHILRIQVSVHSMKNTSSTSGLRNGPGSKGVQEY